MSMEHARKMPWCPVSLLEVHLQLRPDYPMHDTMQEENRCIDVTFPREHLPVGCPSDADLASPLGPSFLPVFPEVGGEVSSAYRAGGGGGRGRCHSTA